MKNETYSPPESSCPYCEHKFDRATALSDGGGPKPGDLTICIECGGWSVFDEQIHMRIPTAEEIASLDPETHKTLTRATKLIKEIAKSR